MTKAKALPVTAPAAADPATELHAFLRKAKTSLVKRWSYSRMETLYEIAGLAWCLLALGRGTEAQEVAGSVASAMPAPPALPGGGVNYNLWCPATFSHGLVAHLGGGGAKASYSALVADPGVARDNPAYVVTAIVDAPSEIAKAYADPSLKWATQQLAGVLGKLAVYEALAQASDPLVEGRSADIRAGLELARTQLRSRLEAGR